MISVGFDPHPHELAWAVAREDWVKCNRCRKMVITAIPFLHCTSCPTPEVLAGSRWGPWRGGYDVCGRCAELALTGRADRADRADCADPADPANRADRDEAT